MTIKPSLNSNININQTNIANTDIDYVLYTLYTLDVDYVLYTLYTLDVDYVYYIRYIYDVDYILSHLNSIAITILVILMQRFSIS